MYLRSPGGAMHRLEAGDAVLLPRGGPHALLSSPDQSASRDIASCEAAPLCKAVSAVRNGSPEACQENGVVIFSGCMEFDLGGMHPLVGLMPEVMRVDTLLERHPEMLPILQAMEREAKPSGQASRAFCRVLPMSSRPSSCVVGSSVAVVMPPVGRGPARSQTRARYRRHASRARASMDGRRAGKADGQLAIGLRRALLDRHRADSSSLHDRVAHAPGHSVDRSGRPAHRRRRPTPRLWLSGSLQPRLQASDGPLARCSTC